MAIPEKASVLTPHWCTSVPLNTDEDVQTLSHTLLPTLPKTANINPDTTNNTQVGDAALANVFTTAKGIWKYSLKRICPDW